ncbi:hypothetical protein OHA77_09345 [Streptosporangium sp. NBC_01639]|uniref:hypothetical protein n=1 Tax=Streptosporangium sp. NBC_01639 TaxID=2975948 RepID=UPI003866F804|nr:hypothetical protein OHA77_09345 [Streptosporangium sp. NBC_01639]
MARGLGRNMVRQLLGLGVWEIELAVTTGLLRRLPDRTFDPVSVRAAEADIEHFRRLLAAERRCTITEASTRLGVSADRFKRIVAAAGLAPVATEQIRKYGRTLTVRYYRAADVDALADHVHADAELRAAARAVSRSEAARKAVQTRKLNIARTVAARAEIETIKPTLDADHVRVLLWTAALMAAAGVWPGPLRPLQRMADPRVPPLTEMLRDARLSRTELEVMLAELAPRAVEPVRLLVSPRDAERELGVPIEMVPAELPHFGDHLLAPLLRETVSAPPPWLLRARAEVELQRAVHAEEQRAVEESSQRHRVERAAVDQAARVASRLSDESVAELFGIPVDVIRQLRPASGRWAADHVAGLLRKTPPWLRDESAARAEADRRRHRAERKAARRLSWRGLWAEALGVPLDRIPGSVGRPTRAAIEAARRKPPRWARETPPG